MVVIGFDSKDFMSLVSLNDRMIREMTCKPAIGKYPFQEKKEDEEKEEEEEKKEVDLD
jgi:hypothetical protein